jgi:hypothetical protein
VSLLSEWLRKVLVQPKHPQLLDCKRIDPRRVQLLGKEVLIEVVARASGGYGIIFRGGDDRRVYEFDPLGRPLSPPSTPEVS